MNVGHAYGRSAMATPRSLAALVTAALAASVLGAVAWGGPFGSARSSLARAGDPHASTTQGRSPPEADVLSAKVASGRLIRAKAWIGQKGGTLASRDGRIRLEIPPGAIGKRTRFTIEQLPVAPSAGVNRIPVSPAFEIGPSGTTFAVPATLTLRFDVPPRYRLPSSYPEDTTFVRFWNPETGRWRAERGSTVDPGGSTISVPLRHLSLWAGASVTEPHGAYADGTDLCGYCHQAHKAPGPNLHPYNSERETCYQCHDGTGANTDIRTEFGEATIGSSTRTSFHPVPTSKDGFRIVCSDCHTSHRLRSDYTKLLRVSAGGSYVYSPTGSPIGNAFCYACHGATSAYPGRFGDHTAFDASAHGTDPSIPLPASGSGIECLACHASHGSDSPGLTTSNQETLCYTCHTQADPKTSGGSNPYTAFTARSNDTSTADGNGIRIYHHPLANAEQAGGTRQVECVSCHNTHLADTTDTATTSKLVDPADVTSKWIVTWDAGSASMSRGNIGQWCVKCHVGPDTTQPISVGPRVPYDVRLVNDTAVDADTNVHDKFSAANWTTSARHGPVQANLACTACHDFHGSTNAYMLRETIVSPDGTSTSTISGFSALDADWPQLQTMCLTCHPTRGTNHGANRLCTRCHYHGSGRF